MYKIIGADQKEYGPVSADQIRQWITEGRANGATLAQAEGAVEFNPLSTFPEFADALQAGPFPPSAPIPPSDAGGLTTIRAGDDYDLDIGDCLSRAWALFQANAGLLIGATAIFVLLLFALNRALGFFTTGSVESLMAGDISAQAILVVMLANIPEIALSSVLTGGFYTLLLKLIRGQPAGLPDVFSGFGAHFVQLALAGIVVQLLTMVGFLACIVPGVYLSVGWIFTVPLIVDRNMAFWPAMELSRRLVTGRWWLVFCLLIVVALLSVIGFLACCIGLVVALPVALGALIYAYEDISRGRSSATPTPL